MHPTMTASHALGEIEELPGIVGEVPLDAVVDERHDDFALVLGGRQSDLEAGVVQILLEHAG